MKKYNLDTRFYVIQTKKTTSDQSLPQNI